MRGDSADIGKLWLKYQIYPDERSAKQFIIRLPKVIHLVRGQPKDYGDKPLTQTVLYPYIRVKHNGVTAFKYLGGKLDQKGDYSPIRHYVEDALVLEIPLSNN